MTNRRSNALRFIELSLLINKLNGIPFGKSLWRGDEVNDDQQRLVLK